MDFYIANVKNPTLGADFLQNYNLLEHNTLSDGLTLLKVQGIESQEPSPSPTILSTQPSNTYVV